MLDTVTKRKIDNCRNILVGKVPTPKGQVDQITISLIYKFMDDMDREAVAIGGNRSFFVDEFEKYSWQNLIDKRLSGEERFHLYTEGIIKMNQNPHIPQLFRDIFKHAYLPYRDPETLNMFLKEINSFTYDHSERLGDAFEYLLSVLSSQGDAGQFRTPRHIIDFMVDIISPQKHETILDPACGTAGFLISSYKYILKNNKKVYPGDLLSPDERQKLSNNIEGYDISFDMVRLSLVNMYLHSIKSPQIFEYDSLSSEEKWNDSFDIIMANPPFMSPKGGIIPHKRFSIQAKRSEVLFVDYIMEHLNINGRAAVIVPEGIIFQSANAYKQLRKNLVENNFLWCVVSLPAGVFNPYSGVKTSILLLDRNKAKLSDKILFVKIDNDGHDLGAQRRPINLNDLPKALNIIQSNVVKDADIAHWVEKNKIVGSGDWNLSGERYKETIEISTDWNMVFLKDVAEYINGYAFKPSEWKQDGKKIIRIQNLTKSRNEYNYTDRMDLPDKYLVQKNDLLISWSATIGFYIWFEEDSYLNQHIFKVVVDETKILRKYLFYLGDMISEKILVQVHGNTMTHITKGRFEQIKIPLPPLSIQKEIVAEIEGNQKIIDGARQVVDNYKPTIKIDPELEMVKMKEVCDFATGGTPRSTVKEYYEDGNIKWLVSGDIHKENIYDCNGRITKEGMDSSNTKYLPINSVLIALNGQGKTRGTVAILRSKATCNQSLISINPRNQSELISEYIYLVLKGMYQSIRNITGDNHRSGLSMKIIREIKIPIPPLSDQKVIVAQIEAEQEIVNANKKLIKIFEQKIKDKINEVWGK